MTSIRTVLSLLLVMSSAAVAAPRHRAAAPPVACFSAVLAEASTGTVVLDNGFVYYGDWASRGVYRVAKTGGAPQLLAIFPCCVVTQMVADADHVYVAMRRHGEAIQAPNDKWVYDIVSIGKGGGAVVTLAQGVWLPQQLAVDDQFVYWASLGTVIGDPKFASDGKVERVEKDGTGRTTLASGLSGPTSVAVDDSFVYFGESGLAEGNTSKGVRRVPRNGGTVQRLYDNPVDLLALNGDDLYLLYENYSANKTSITRVAKAGGQVKRSFTDVLVIYNPMTIFDGRIYYYSKAKDSAAVASVTLDLEGRRVHVERLLNGQQIGVDSCALYISTVAPADFEVERVMK
jgi:hypothetical protein